MQVELQKEKKKLGDMQYYFQGKTPPPCAILEVANPHLVI